MKHSGGSIMLWELFSSIELKLVRVDGEMNTGQSWQKNFNRLLGALRRPSQSTDLNPSDNLIEVDFAKINRHKKKVCYKLQNICSSCFSNIWPPGWTQINNLTIFI